MDSSSPPQSFVEYFRLPGAAGAWLQHNSSAAAAAAAAAAVAAATAGSPFSSPFNGRSYLWPTVVEAAPGSPPGEPALIATAVHWSCTATTEVAMSSQQRNLPTRTSPSSPWLFSQRATSGSLSTESTSSSWIVFLITERIVKDGRIPSGTIYHSMTALSKYHVRKVVPVKELFGPWIQPAMTCSSTVTTDDGRGNRVWCTITIITRIIRQQDQHLLHHQ